MIQLLSINWNVDPVLVNFGFVAIRYYSLCWALCFAVSYVVFRKIFKKEKIKFELLDKLTINYVIPLTFIGARVGHCLFYEGDYYLSHPFEIILPIHNGKFLGYAGLASHGAAFGILLALWLYCRKYKMPYIWSLDRIAIAVPIAGAIVRLGNLMNSEVYGHATNLPWGFIFARNGDTTASHPTQIYEALAYILLFAILYYLFFKKDFGIKKPGVIFGIFLTVLFAARFLIEFVKNDQETFEQEMWLNMGQWLSLPFIIAGIVIFVYYSKRKTEVREVKKLKKIGS
ncbi:MAG: prolipoprotein diacylglyceryl transferase [Prevotellaceae bacterium]|jgi:prolipoprotein diacylglyceryl transferase|nr:prolipoprotein diacylglyceryl transferase [Prevotellaceae bacterium]